MSRLLIIAEHDGVTLNQSTARCVACATAIGPSAIDVLVLASDPAAVASQEIGRASCRERV